MLPEAEEGNEEGGERLRERKTIALPVEALDDPRLSSSEIYLLAQILRFQSRIDRYTVNGLNQFLNLSKNTIRKGLLLLAESGYMTTLPDNKGWAVNKIKICSEEDQNLNSERSKFELEEIKICASEREEERTKEEDKDTLTSYNIYNNSSLRVTENEKEKDKKEKDSPAAVLDSKVKPEEPERFTEEYREIIGYLNEKTGKKFSARSRVNQGHISARLKEGFTVEDFKRVIDVKWFQWHDDAKMAKFLRPETLFGTKFDRYLNEEKVVTRVDENGWEYTVSDKPHPLDEIFGGSDG